MKALLTYEELAVELQVDVSVARGLLGGDGQVVQSKRRLLDVPLSSDLMPPVVVQQDPRVHMNLQGPVSNIEGENHPSGSWRKTETDFEQLKEM